MNLIHSEWMKIQELLKDIELSKFRDHPVIRKWLLSVSNRFTADDFIAEAHSIDPQMTKEILGKFNESNVGTMKKVLPTAYTAKSALFILYAVKLKKYFPHINEWNIMEIGGGYGGLARLFTICDLCKSYHIADINVIHSIQKYFLSNGENGPIDNRICLFNVENETHYRKVQEGEYDLLISAFALTEAPAHIQKQYIRDFATRCKYIYIVGQKNFKGIDSFANIIGEISNYFDYRVNEYSYYEADRPAFELIGSRKLKNINNPV